MSQLRPAVPGWDDPQTAHYYEEFCGRHDRYQKANEALAARAELKTGQFVLDLAAGTGRTAEAVLPYVGITGRILCVETSAEMRAVGMRRLPDPRIEWAAEFPDLEETFNRILCGAGIWQFLPLGESIRRLAALLKPGGALCFNIPSLYLCEPDEAGGGKDPLLLELPSLLGCPAASEDVSPQPPRSAEELEALLEAAGLRPTRWDFRFRFTQEAFRDWLKIPVLTHRLLPEMNANERARAIDNAYRHVDPGSWRWERWAGWTAWKPLKDHAAGQSS